MQKKDIGLSIVV